MLKSKPSFAIDVFPQLVVSLENSLDMHLGLDLDMHPKSRTENLDPGRQDVIWPLLSFPDQHNHIQTYHVKYTNLALHYQLVQTFCKTVYWAQLDVV